MESDGDRGEERRDWLLQTESENLFFLKACKTVDGVCVLGVTPKVIRSATPLYSSRDLFKLRTSKRVVALRCADKKKKWRERASEEKYVGGAGFLHTFNSYSWKPGESRC